MRIVIHISKFYDWLPVPEDVKVTEKDIKRRLVKPALGGGWLMRVEKDQATYTEISISELDLIMTMVTKKFREKQTLNRAQTAAFILGTRVMPDEAKPAWMKKVEVLDDAVPDHLPTKEEKDAYLKKATEFFLAAVRPYVDGDGAILDEADLDELLEAYTTHFTDRELEKFFAAHFGIKEA